MALIWVFAQPRAQRGGSCGRHPGTRSAVQCTTQAAGQLFPGVGPLCLETEPLGSIFQSMCHFTLSHPSLSLCFAGKAMPLNFPQISSKGNWYFPELLFFLSKSSFKQFARKGDNEQQKLSFALTTLQSKT